MWRSTLQRLDEWVPSNLRDDPDTLRRARLSLLFAAILCCQAILFGPLFYALGAPQAALCVGIGSVGWALTPVVLRTGSIRLAGGTLTFSLIFIITGAGFYIGGPHSAAPWWGSIAGVVALLVADRRVAASAIATVIAVNGAAFAASAAGYRYPALLSSTGNLVLDASASTMLAVVTLSLAWMFEDTKERMRRALVEQNAAMSRVLDHVGQGFLCVDPAGRIVDEHSRILEQWFGPLPVEADVWVYLGREDPRFSAWLELCWQALGDGFLPTELCIGQLPTRFQHGARVYDLAYRAIEAGDRLTRVVVVVTDVTEMVATARAEAAQRELALVLDHVVRDRTGFFGFLQEADELVAGLAPDAPDLARSLHTLKGNCGMFGLASLAERIQQLEAREYELGTPPGDDDLAQLRAEWRTLYLRVTQIAGIEAHVGELNERHYRALLEAVRRHPSHVALEDKVLALRFEPAERALRRAAEHARALARRLGRGEIRILVEDDDGIALDPGPWADLWASFTHLVRNAVDHGLETPEERLETGKTETGELRFRVGGDDEQVTIELTDDGRGIDWERVRLKAEGLGLPHESREELVEALFTDGLSTRSELTAVSGRGVGLAAFRDAVARLGGEITIEAAAPGTRVRIAVPARSRGIIAQVIGRPVELAS